MKFDENSNYKNDLITFTVNQINNSNLTIKTIPNSMLNFLKKISESSDSNISNVVFTAIETLNERSIINSENFTFNNENNINNNFNNLNNNK